MDDRRTMKTFLPRGEKSAISEINSAITSKGRIFMIAKRKNSIFTGWVNSRAEVLQAADAKTSFPSLNANLYFSYFLGRKSGSQALIWSCGKLTYSRSLQKWLRPCRAIMATAKTVNSGRSVGCWSPLQCWSIYWWWWSGRGGPWLGRSSSWKSCLSDGKNWFGLGRVNSWAKTD